MESFKTADFRHFRPKMNVYLLGKKHLFLHVTVRTLILTSKVQLFVLTNISGTSSSVCIKSGLWRHISVAAFVNWFCNTKTLIFETAVKQVKTEISCSSEATDIQNLIYFTPDHFSYVGKGKFIKWNLKALWLTSSSGWYSITRLRQMRHL